MKDRFVLNNEMNRALAGNRAIVALETTVVTHGLPHPQGVEAALLLEDDVRANGAVPATIGVWDGAVHVGITRDELTALAEAKDVTKLNLSNFAATLSAGRPGSTTVAATMFAAHLAGISVFATGGIGGVHRGAELTGDVSADLTELAQTPVAVVSAGAKAILDLPRTLEMLETLSVPVIGYGTDEFPAFYSRGSGLKLAARADTPDAVARILAARWRLPQSGGVLVANPIPAADEIPAAAIEGRIRGAMSQAERAGVSGKEVTPFLLARIRDLTDGESQRANVALVYNNARLAADIAVAFVAH